MKSPTDLRLLLKRRWENASIRESKLLGGPGAWPWILSIGKPSSRMILNDLDGVRRHIEAWRRVRIGSVGMESIRFRSTGEGVEVPITWTLHKPSDWIDAIGETSVRREFEALSTLVGSTDAAFHSLWVRRRSLWLGRSTDEIVQGARLAMKLSPGCAEGRPLRTLGLEGIDTKFFERNEQLLTTLLDLRYEGEVSRMGLEPFLDAWAEGDHWLLVIDLDGGLLPFQKMRVRSSELAQMGVAGEKLLIVENETCQHLLPRVAGTIAVLGAGFDVSWTSAAWLREKRIAYWGDLDTWGLQFLSKVRTSIENVSALMMTPDVYEAHQRMAVPEPVVAGFEVPSGLTPLESDLYRRLLAERCGRLEQEYLPKSVVEDAILGW